MFGAEKFASTSNTFLPKSLTRDEAVSRLELSCRRRLLLIRMLECLSCWEER